MLRKNSRYLAPGEKKLGYGDRNISGKAGKNGTYIFEEEEEKSKEENGYIGNRIYIFTQLTL